MGLQHWKKIIDAASGKETLLNWSFLCCDCLEPLQNEDAVQISYQDVERSVP